MIIRTQQRHSFIEAQRRAQLSAWRRKYPRQTLGKSDDDLIFLILEADDRGGHYGFRKSEHILAFAECFIALGSGFDNPQRCLWAARILNNPLLTPGARLAELHGKITHDQTVCDSG